MTAQDSLASGRGADVTIYHNPACGTSRNVLAMIRNAGIEPRVVEYLKSPPSRATLEALIARMGIAPRALLRPKEAIYATLGLDEERWTDAELVSHMLEHPVLMNRPVVVTARGAALCRPSEVVLDLLPAPQQAPFAKEDGEVVIGPDGRRVR